LTRAVKLQARAAKVGFDWPSTDEVYDKIAEEIAELRDAAPRSDQASLAIFCSRSPIWRDIGGIDAEAAVRAANEKFVRRFRHIEDELEKRGRMPSQSTLAEMDELWNGAKSAEEGSIPPRG